MESDKIKVKTPSGFECSVDRAIYDDWDFTKISVRMQESIGTDASKLWIAKFVMYIEEHGISGEDLKRLREHVKEKDGQVTASGMERELVDIINAANESKNSESSLS